MLVGQELLDKARALSSRREDEIARGCGYVGPSGRVLKKSFYRALVEAKGYTLPSASNSGGGQCCNVSRLGWQSLTFLPEKLGMVQEAVRLRWCTPLESQQASRTS